MRYESNVPSLASVKGIANPNILAEKMFRGIMSRDTVYKLWNAPETCKGLTLSKAAEIFGVKIDDLFYRVAE